MAGNAFDIIPLEEVIEDVLDRRGVTPLKLGSHFKDSGHRVISAKVIKGGRVDLSADEARFVDAKTYNKWMRIELDADDVILTSEAPLGEVAYLPTKVDWCLGQRLFAIRPKRNILEGRFLFYALQSVGVRSDLLARASGTTVQGVRQTELRKVMVPLPPLGEQRAIASILGALDDKIELNRKMSATLEAMARAIFTSWFVDFDPVRAKAEGRDPRLPAEMAALFSDSFEDSELGQIPRGWSVQAIGDIITRLGVGRKYERKTVASVGNVPVLDQGKTGVIGYHSAEPGIKATPENLVIVFANHTCYMRLLDFPFSTIQNVLPFVGKGVETIWAYYATVDKQGFVEYKGHWPDFIQHKIVVPKGPLCIAFTNLVKPMVARMSLATTASQALSELRNALLPRLISGEVRVSDAERILEMSA